MAIGGCFVGGLKNRGIGMIGDIFEYTATTSGAIAKWIEPADSAHSIGLFIHSYGILIVVGGASSGVSKIAELNSIGHVTIFTSRTRCRMAKPMPEFDWLDQISLNEPSNGISILV